MNSWVPTTDFENEIVSLQPYHNFIYGALSEAQPEEHIPRPPSHVAYAAKKQEQARSRQSSNNPSLNGKLHVIEKVQKICGTLALGELPTVNDWDDDRNVERETVAMMRSFGLGPSIEEPITDECTLPTLPITDGMRVNHNGAKRMPVYFDRRFFKLKPRAVPKSVAEESLSSNCTSRETESSFLENTGYDNDNTTTTNNNRGTFPQQSVLHTGSSRGIPLDQGLSSQPLQWKNNHRRSIVNKTFDIPCEENGSSTSDYSEDSTNYSFGKFTGSSSSCYTARSSTTSSWSSSEQESITSVPSIKSKKNRGKLLISNSLHYKRNYE